MKLHLGVGDVYLPPEEGWVNIDARIAGYSFLASDRPDLVAANRTNLGDYYKHPYTMDGPVDRPCVADAFMDVSHLDYPDQSVSDIVAVQILEHFTPAEARQALRDWFRVLAPHGRLLVDTIDFLGLIERMRVARSKKELDYWFRMVYGSYKNDLACHKDGFTRDKLHAAVCAAGFVGLVDMDNPFGHPYPSLTVVAERP